MFSSGPWPTTLKDFAGPGSNAGIPKLKLMKIASKPRMSGMHKSRDTWKKLKNLWKGTKAAWAKKTWRHSMRSNGGQTMLLKTWSLNHWRKWSWRSSRTSNDTWDWIINWSTNQSSLDQVFGLLLGRVDSFFRIRGFYFNILEDFLVLSSQIIQLLLNDFLNQFDLLLKRLFSVFSLLFQLFARILQILLFLLLEGFKLFLSFTVGVLQNWLHSENGLSDLLVFLLSFGLCLSREILSVLG